MAGVPRRIAAAQWIADLWRRLNLPIGAHAHRIHYILISQPEPVRMVAPLRGSWDYVNTEYCDQELAHAVRDARYLGLIPFEAVTDQRNAMTTVYYRPEESEPEVYIDGAEPDIDPFRANISVDLRTFVATPKLPDLPRLSITAPQISQPVCVELWCEKSTVDDMLDPLCREHGCNYTSGTGEISLTRCHDLIARAREHGKPVRVLTISDFDPRGHVNMPVSFARKLEFLIRKLAPDIDLQVEPIALTHDQCVEFELPRTPLKETEQMAPGFEKRFGEGATELDALEALHPGELGRIVEEAILRFIEPDLDDQISDATDAAQEALDEITDGAHDDHAEERDALEQEHASLVAEVNAEVSRFRESVAPLMAEIKERARMLNEDLETRFSGRFNDLVERNLVIIQCRATLDEAPDADSFEWPEPGWDDFEDPLFDSSRDYMEQIASYKRHQGKEEGGAESRKTYDMTCIICRTAFTARRNDSTTCSIRCRNAFHNRKRKTARRENGKARKLYKRTCVICGDPFEASRIERQYCEKKKCLNAFHNRKRAATRSDEEAA
jgi:hypothetical protein